MTGSLSATPGLLQYQEALTELKDCTDPKLHYARGHSEPDMQNPGLGSLKANPSLYNNRGLENPETLAPVM